MDNKNNSIGEKFYNFVRKVLMALFLWFLVLRACDITDWAWYWVMSPIIAYVIIYVIVIFLYGLVKAAEKSKEDENG